MPIKQITLWILLLTPLACQAQFSFDVASVESYIHDHKTRRSLLLSRATLEYGNQLLHDYSREQAEDYKNLNFDLDRYTRAFDVIDMVYQSLRLGVNVHSTYKDVSDCLAGYQGILDDYNKFVIKRGKVSPVDTLLLSINYHAVQRITKECGYLYKSVNDLALYVTGVAACSTADLMVILESISTSLDRIREMVNRAYLSTRSYVNLRMGYWKEKVYISRTRQEMVDDAFNRWRESGLNVKVEE